MNTLLSVLPFVLLALVVGIWIVRPLRSTSLLPINSEHSLKALLHHYQAQTHLSAEERDYRLYHELRHLREAKQTKQKNLPALAYALLFINLLAGLGLWYSLSGAQHQQWQNLIQALDQPLKRAQFLHEPLNITGINPLVFCQALQERVDRTQRQQLHTLGLCYFQHQAYDHAQSIYAQLVRRYPTEGVYRLYHIQSQLFRDPERPISPTLETQLKAYVADYPDDVLAQVLLAAAYERAGRADEAKALWQILAQTLPQDHPLSAQIQSRVTTFQLNTLITLSPERQSALPKEARLFLVLSRKDQPIPPVAVKVLPIQAEQSASISHNDLMLSQSFDPRAEYQITAFVSEDGSTKGTRHSAPLLPIQLNDTTQHRLEIP
ncbi:MAG: hypothetical protein Q4B71_03810 [Cardiobacteriaceae bacterium]|nr:hypothetical protein [Cardiobacteriaceae bacterium]